MKKVIFLVVAALLVLGIQNSYALISSSVVFDIAWSGQNPVDTTIWGTAYQTNLLDANIYNGMIEYSVFNWASSPASIRRFEVMFDTAPYGVFTNQVAVLGTPSGWTVGFDSGEQGTLMMWGISDGNPILPGTGLNGFLVDFNTNLATPTDLSKFVQAYDVYEVTGIQHGKGITTPVPEPASLMLLGAGVGILGLLKLRKKA